MTIIFGYFQYINDTFLILITIPMLIHAFFYIALNIFIFKSSRTQLEEKIRPELLYYVGIINIIFLVMPFAIPHCIIVSPTDFELFFQFYYVIFYGLIRSLPFLITYGILIYKFGKLNEQRFNKYLRISGILWFITHMINTITLSGNLYTILGIFMPSSVVMTIIITFNALNFYGVISLIAWILFIIHSEKNNDRNLLIAGILAIISYGASYLYNLFILPSLL